MKRVLYKYGIIYIIHYGDDLSRESFSILYICIEDKVNDFFPVQNFSVLEGVILLICKKKSEIYFYGGGGTSFLDPPPALLWPLILLQ